jgi:hypothetical protein
MKILVACEESQAVTIELRKLGHEAFSCDIIECSGGRPGWHIQGDALNEAYSGKYDMMIAHPPCTYLTCAAEWAFKDIQTKKIKPGTLIGEARRKARIEAIDFFMKLYNAPIEKIAIENPVGIISSVFRRPDQSIQPYEYGDNASKKTCLWLKGLPLLNSTKYVNPRVVNGKNRWANQTDSGQNNLPPSKNRAKLRSKTYTGIAKAMAEQWAGNLKETPNDNNTQQ